jgi:uncharacterized coiled-coil DUF342 family protein
MYLKVMAAADDLYTEFGFDKVKAGRIPSQDEFDKKVHKYYKIVSKEEDFNPVEFETKVKSLHEDLKTKAMSEGAPKGKLESQFKAIGRKIGTLQVVRDGYKGLLSSLATDSKQVIDLLKKERGKEKIDIIFRSEGGDIKIDRLKGLDSHIAVLEDGKPDPANTDAMANYTKALEFAKRAFSSNIDDLTKRIEKLTSMAGTVEGQLKHLGTPITVKEVIEKPQINSPFVEVYGVDGLLKILEGKDEPVVKQKEMPHPFKWLLNPKYPATLMRAIGDTEAPKEKGEEHPLRHKTDIHVVQQDIKDLIARLWSLNHHALEAVPDLEKSIKEETHLLATLPEEDFKWYKDFHKKLKDKHGPSFAELAKWSDKTSEFEKLEHELPPELQADRKMIAEFFSIIKDIRAKNDNLKQHWSKVTDRVDRLKLELSEARRIYTKLSKENYFRDQWKKDDTPVEMRQKKEIPVQAYGIVMAAGYVDSGESFANLQELVANFKQMLEGHKMFDAAWSEVKTPAEKKLQQGDKEMWRVPESAGKAKVKELLQGDMVDDYLDDMQDYITKIKTGIARYIDKVDQFLLGIMTGSSIDKPVADKGQKAAAAHLRRMAQLIRYAEFIVAEEKAVEWKSELPLKIPLGDLDIKTMLLSGRSRFVDYFQKSYPIQEIINEWFKMSGHETLKSELFPQVIQKLEAHMKDQIHKTMNKEDLQKNLDKYETELDGVFKKKKAIFDIMDKAKKWADINSRQLDQEIQNAESLTEAAKVKVTELNKKREELLDKLAEEITQTTKPASDDDSAQHIALENAKKTQEELNKTINDLRNVIGAKSEDDRTLDKLVDFMGGLQHSFSNVNVKKLNELEALQDREIELGRKINQYQNHIENGPTPKYVKRLTNMFILSVWSNLDENWMRNIPAYQTHYNLNFDDYIKIHEEVQKLVGGHVPARAYSRLKKDMDKQVKDLRERGEDIPPGLKAQLSKMLSKRFIVTKQSIQRSIDNFKKYIQKLESGGKEVPEHLRKAIEKLEKKMETAPGEAPTKEEPVMEDTKKPKKKKVEEAPATPLDAEGRKIKQKFDELKGQGQSHLRKVVEDIITLSKGKEPKSDIKTEFSGWTPENLKKLADMIDAEIGKKRPPADVQASEVMIYTIASRFASTGIAQRVNALIEEDLIQV